MVGYCCLHSHVLLHSHEFNRNAMKNTIGFILALVLVAVLIVWSKPTNERCIDECRRQMAGTTPAGKLIGRVAINELTVTVNDYIFYKQINSAIDGRIIGYGCLGVVWCQ
jgi:hypothetical protein